MPASMQLADPPPPGRARELWLQHAAGFILFSHIREYARGRIAPDAGEDARKAAQSAIDDALYGLMMIVDGVPRPLLNPDYRVDLTMIVRLIDRKTDATVDQLDLREGDGVCMGYHFWKDGDFGEDPVVAR